ncbi:MAG: M23 family metallopeptidase [bacterium]|nr:M23 family metallopeptidase [bacterium]
MGNLNWRAENGRIPRAWGILLFFPLVAELAKCGTPYGIYHRVKPGENLFRISRAYGVDLQDLAELNNITNVDQIKAGQKVFIPGASGEVVVYIPEPGSEPAQPPAREERVTVNPPPRKEPEEPTPRIKLEKGIFEWPVRGMISSRFGYRDGKIHDGIDIRAKEGTPVKAAAPGKVIFSSDEIRSYGNLIIIKHESRFSTVYAHNRKNLVREGTLVKKGEVIAEVGITGRASAPHLHFEIREGKKPRNPEFFLP